jgi:hypothetical protein
VFSLRKQVIGESPELGLLRQPGGKLALGHLIELLKSQVVQDILAVLYRSLPVPALAPGETGEGRAGCPDSARSAVRCHGLA